MGASFSIVISQIIVDCKKRKNNIKKEAEEEGAFIKKFGTKLISETDK